MRTSHLVVLFLLFQAWFLVAAPAHGQVDSEATALPGDAPTDEALTRAREAFGDGNAAYLEGRYRDAVQHFERANNIVPNPRLLEYMGRCYSNLGDYAQAIRSYQAFSDSSSAAAVEVTEVLAGLRHDAMVNAMYKASDSLDAALAAANGETPPPRDLRRQELGTQMRDVTVQIRTTPRGADVFIDAIELGAVGQTPLETPLFTGRHFIEVRREHYATQSRVVNVTVPGAGQSIPVVEFDLVRLQVPVEVTVSPPTARVTFVSDAGERVDMGIGGWNGILPAGPGAFLLQQGGRDRRIEYVVTAADSGTVQIALALDALQQSTRTAVRIGHVIVVVEHLEDARVLVDGRDIGATPGTFESEVTVGTHTIEIVRDGFETWRQDVEVAADGETRIYGPSSLTRARRR